VIGREGLRPELLERTILALADVREPQGVLAGIARLLETETGCPCTLLAPDRVPPELSAAVPATSVWRSGDRAIVAAIVDGELRAGFSLRCAHELSDDDVRTLRLVSAHASLALSNALAFDQLRHHAREGAALGEAARTVLGFTELQPLAAALCALARRFFNAERSVLYGRTGDELRVLGSSAVAGAPGMPGRLPLDRDEADALMATSAEQRAFALAALRLPAHDGEDRSGLLAVMRVAPFEKADHRLLDGLVTLAALAIRNVELYEESARANRALAESNAFKDDLMAMFAHDFKGPLTVISGFTELMLEDGLEGEQRTAAQTVLAQAGRLAKLSPSPRRTVPASRCAGSARIWCPSSARRFATRMPAGSASSSPPPRSPWRCCSTVPGCATRSRTSWATRSSTRRIRSRFACRPRPPKR
jgi:hypothetical protein